MSCRATSRSRSGIRFKGTIFDALTIAESRPASTASCRKTEFKTTREAAFKPKEMFETPSIVKQPGSSDFILRSASMVSAALRRSRSEEHTSELQSRQYFVCRLLLE